jgi:cytochrome c
MFMAAALLLASPLALRREARPPAPESPAAHSADEPFPAAAKAGEVDFITPYFALDPSAPVDAEAAQAAFNPADPYGGLPQTEGFDLVAAQCSACHSLNVVMQQSLPRERWDALLDWMVARQKMPAPDARTRAAILDYLAQNFGA